jgi:probable addiction module antidote protein
MTAKLRPHDPTRYLETDQDIAEFLDAVLEDGDPATIADSIGIVARARGMTQLARETGLSRESLYRALNREGNPELATIMKVLGALGVRLRATVAA